MQFEQMLEALGVTSESIREAEKESLERDGLLVWPMFFSEHQVTTWLEQIQVLPQTEVHSSLVASIPCDHDPILDFLWCHPRILAAASQVLQADFFLESVQYRAPLPAREHPAIHTDTVLEPPIGVLRFHALIALTDFTEHNGATKVQPGSHLAGNSETVRRRTFLGPLGSAFLFQSGLSQSGTSNESESPRHSVLVSYARRDSAGGKAKSQTAPSWLGEAARRLLDPKA